MEINYINLDKTKAFKNLKQAEKPDIKELLEPERIKSDMVHCGSGLEMYYGAKEVDSKILTIMQELSDEMHTVPKYREILAGKIMNRGENRMVMHHYTRGDFGVLKSDKAEEIKEHYSRQKERFFTFASKIHTGEITGSTGKIFNTVVQIGIGGSDLGPRALYLALKGYMSSEGRKPKLRAEFISNVDPDDAAEVCEKIDPETTLFILVSKSGTTQETLTNREIVLKIASEKSPSADLSKHMIAVTSETSPLASSDDFLDSFYIDDFIGGRYSSTSAVGGVMLSLAFGRDVFQRLLDGAHAADMNALEEDIQKNGALLSSLISIYERNISGYPVTSILPYSQALSRFPAHLQQLIMESNGKSVNVDNRELGYSTSGVYFGEPGTNGQHSFYQQLHQGTDIVPVEFIGFRKSQYLTDIDTKGSTSQKKLNANLAAQITAFALGQENDNRNRNFCGLRPSLLLAADRLTPEVIGALLAFYENRTMFQGFLWNINSFDQEGVQLGKTLANKALSDSSDSPVLNSYSEILS